MKCGRMIRFRNWFILWGIGCELRCLAENVYFEARGEPLEGQYAIAEVTKTSVQPYWARRKQSVARIGNHVFYR